MKRCIAILLALLLLSACGAGARPSDPELESGSSSIPEPASSEPVPEPELLPGRVLADLDAARFFSGAVVKGTQEDLGRWEKAVRGPVVRMEYSELGERDRELPVADEEEILSILREAELRLYGPEDQLPNPWTGGAWTVIAYDEGENILFCAHFLGNLLYARIGDEDAQYVFDGEYILPDVLLPTPGPPVERPDDAPDPGVYAPDLSPDAMVRQQCEAMAEYLESKLDPWDYTEISSFSGDGSSIEISAPSPDKAEDLVKGILENYTGVIVPINYYPALFSIGQLEQAKNDLERFFEEHPEIEEARWAPIPVNNGYRIFIKEANDKVTAFVNGYSVPGIYEIAVGDPLLPD